MDGPSTTTLDGPIVISRKASQSTQVSAPTGKVSVKRMKRGPNLTKILREALMEPDEIYPTKGDKLIAMAIEYAAAGNYQFFKEIMDRIDGKVKDEIDLNIGAKPIKQFENVNTDDM